MSNTREPPRSAGWSVWVGIAGGLWRPVALPELTKREAEALVALLLKRFSDAELSPDEEPPTRLPGNRGAVKATKPKKPAKETGGSEAAAKR